MRFIIMLTLLTQTLFGADPIGKMVAVDGIVNAIAENVKRVLDKNSDIFAQETVVVGSNSRAQIQFTDGGLMNLLPDSEFRVNTYKYKKALQKDQFASELLKGGLRTLSGSIAKKNPNEYDIKTPSGTIGLRGTIVDVRLVGDSLYVGVEKGRALVSNAAGSSLIGTGQSHQFVTVPGNFIPPILVLERPEELETSYFASPVDGLSIDQAQAQQTIKTLPPQPSQVNPARGDAPSIGETPDDSGIQYAPTGGGASIQGGC